MERPDHGQGFGWLLGQSGGTTPSVHVLVQHDGSQTVIRVTGRVDRGSAPTLRNALRGALASTTHPVVVDLSGLAPCDPAGLAALHDAESDASALGRPMTFRGPAPLLTRLHAHHADAPGIGAERTPEPAYHWSGGGSPTTTDPPDVPHQSRPWPTR